MLFNTREGRVRNRPVDMQAGDIVAVIHGAELPFILRALDNGCYTLVGAAIVEGVMDGKALAEDPKSRSFNIC